MGAVQKKQKHKFQNILSAPVCIHSSNAHKEGMQLQGSIFIKQSSWWLCPSNPQTKYILCLASESALLTFSADAKNTLIPDLLTPKYTKFKIFTPKHTNSHFLTPCYLIHIRWSVTPQQWHAITHWPSPNRRPVAFNEFYILIFLVPPFHLSLGEVQSAMSRLL